MGKICNNCISAIYRYLYFYLMELARRKQCRSILTQQRLLEWNFSDNAGTMIEKYPLWSKIFKMKYTKCSAPAYECQELDNTRLLDEQPCERS